MICSPLPKTIREKSIVNILKLPVVKAEYEAFPNFIPQNPDPGMHD